MSNLGTLNTQTNHANYHMLDKVLNSSQLNAIHKMSIMKSYKKNVMGPRLEARRGIIWKKVDVLAKSLEGKNTSTTISIKTPTSQSN